MTALLIVGDKLRCRFAHFNLRAHLLQARSKRFNLLLLVRGSRLEVLLQLHDGRFLFPHFAVLFEELIEQHRVDRLVANGNDFALLVARHQIRIHGGHVLGDKAKIRRARRINLLLVAEADRFKREERFAGLIHRFDVLLVASRGALEAKFAASAYSNKDAVSLRRRADVSDPGDVALARNTNDVLADTDITTSRDIETGLKAQSNVRAAGYVLIERMGTDGR